jgi:hypothetical protein
MFDSSNDLKMAALHKHPWYRVQSVVHEEDQR